MSQTIQIITLRYGFGVNCYLCRTDNGYFLIDTGFKRKRADLLEALDRAGCEPGNLPLIILTHGDPDHVGNAAYLREKYGAHIAMHADDSGMVADGDICWNRHVNLFQRIFLKTAARLVRFELFQPDFFIKEGDNLAPYGFDAQVVHLPGHSAGSIGLLTRDGDLFCGDLLNNIRQPDIHIMIDDAAGRSSVEKLKGLDITTVYPGHGKPFQMQELIASI